MFEFLFKYSRDDYLRSEVAYLSDLPASVFIGLAIVGVGAIAFMLFSRRKYTRPGQTLSVGILQILMFALILWVLLQPHLVTEQLRDGENTIALVLDSSSSMAYGAGETRIDTATRVLATASDSGDAPQFSVSRYELSATAKPVDSFTDSVASGDTTALVSSLQGVMREARVSPLAAIVLASDGADTNGGLSPADIGEIAAFGVPIHTIGVGREVIPEDIEMSEVAMPAKVLPGSTIAARVSIRHDGPADAQVKVYDGEDLLAVQPVSLNDSAGSTTAWIDVALPEAGHRQLKFAVDGGSDDRELRNNVKTTLVEVANQSYKILYYEGEPRWEYKFLRRAIELDNDLQIASLLRVSQNKHYRQGIESPLQLEGGFPATRDELFVYDAIIIGSVEAASFESSQLELIRDFVSERGGSLLMLAGPNGLGNGGWGQTDVADALPVSLPSSARNTFHRKRAIVQLTPQGADSQVLRFAESDADNRALWADLPEIADYQLTGNLKPAAATWLTAQTDIGQIPLLVSQPFGRGYSYILASGGTWRWQMSLPVENQSHETFWRQLLREMVASAPDNVALVAAADAAAASVRLRAEFRDDAFRPLDGVGVSAVATHVDGASWTLQLLPDENEPGVFATEFVPDQSGTWYFEAIAERDGEPVDVARSSIHFETGQAEHFNVRRNTTLLRQLADATGGQFLEVGELASLPDLLRYNSAGITEQQFRSIWDLPAVWLLLFLIKASEWMLRRRWGNI